MDIKLGHLLERDERRDAIHIAITPAVSREELKPGEHVGLLPDGTVARASAKVAAVGIVDPFLTGEVPAGGRFWVCLYQQTVTGMRHCWSHPAFPEEGSGQGQNQRMQNPAKATTPLTAALSAPIGAGASDAELNAELKRQVVERVDRDRACAMAWINDYAASIHVEPDDLLDAAAAWVKSQDYYVPGGTLEGVETIEEFWTYYKMLTGVESTGNFFSCSC